MDRGFGTTERQDAPPEWWRAWFARDYSWQGLARLPGHGGRTLQDEWREEAADLIAEPGTDRLWTRFHCPLFFADGSLSPKVTWTSQAWRDVYARVRTRLALSGPERPCHMDGMVLDGLDESEDALDPDVTVQLWLSARDACFLRPVGARNLRFGLADFTGAWLGGGADFTGSVIHEAGSAAASPPVTAPPAPAVTQPPSNLPNPIVTEPEPVQTPDAPPPPKRRLKLWLAAGAALIGAAAVLILRSM